MLLNVYERVVALQDLYQEVGIRPGLDYSMRQTMLEVGMFESGYPNQMPLGEKSMAVKRAVQSFELKIYLIAKKQEALTNLSRNIQVMADDNATILNLAFETARSAFTFRQNLELSILNSNLKMLEIEALQIKGMTAAEFEAKYGA